MVGAALRYISVQHPRQVGPLRFVVQLDRHQRHVLDNPKTVREAPTEELCVACWKEEPGARILRRRANESFQVIVRLADGVSKQANARRVTADPAVVLNHAQRALLEGIDYLARR